MEEWEKEISQYSDRIIKLSSWHPNLSRYIKSIPDIPLKYTPNQTELVAIQISLFALNCFASTNQTLKSFLVLWNNRCFSTISLPTRLIYELWGAIHYAKKIFLQIQNPEKVESISKKINILLLGSRSEVKLPWGGITTERAINVMDFVRSLTDIRPQAEKTYEFLCSSCHPSYLMQSYWQMMGPTFDNWSNPKFAEHSHDLIEKTINAIEQALDGIVADTIFILDLSIPYFST